VGVDPSGNGGLAAALSDGARLIVLDNLQQVISVAPALASLLAAAPPLKLLVTSQVPLRIGGEKVVRLAPLDATDAASPAVQLFATRAEGREIGLFEAIRLEREGGGPS
jgi:predicted ATPase